jgi:hypothetical protein
LATTTGGTITYTQPNGVANGVGALLTTTGAFNLVDTANVQTVGIRILVKNEANAVTNGVYTWANATNIVRSTDTDEYGANSTEQISVNDYFFVSSGNVNAGSGASLTGGLTLADDFTVTGLPWSVSKLSFFGYSTNYAGATSPFTDLRMQIFDTDPSVGNPAPIFGDLTTNRLTASTATNLYRIFNATAGTTRLIWKMEASITNLILRLIYC